MTDKTEALGTCDGDKTPHPQRRPPCRNWQPIEAPEPQAAQPASEADTDLRELRRAAEVFAARVMERNPEWFRETDTDFAEADHALRAALRRREGK
jgi:hypothetical protein